MIGEITVSVYDLFRSFIDAGIRESRSLFFVLQLCLMMMFHIPERIETKTRTFMGVGPYWWFSNANGSGILYGP